MRKKIVAGNWKMNLLPEEANQLFKELNTNADWPADVKQMIFPPAIYIQSFAGIKGEHMTIGAQNFFQKEKGAYTGELSISQVLSVGAEAVLIGHSERRAYFGEHDEFLKEKVDAALANKATIVFCCGEPLEVREADKQNDFVKNQLEASLFHLDGKDMKNVVIAYEPVWAIGTGKTASVQQAEDMHAFIRKMLTEKYDAEVANEVSILYGGSCNPGNAKELFACPNVDGGLIGGASLKSADFTAIANAY